MDKNPKRILVTGVAGFIGSNLAKRLIANGHEVIGFDNLSQGLLLNIDDLMSNKMFHWIEGDVRDLNSVCQAARGCNTIYHLAAYKIPRYGNAYDTLDINSRGTLHAIEAAVREKAQLIFSSTSDVYGRNPNLPFAEESDLVLGGPQVRRWAYAVSKAFDEQLIFAEKERRNLIFSIVRFFGGYGPNQNLSWWGGPQSVFINHALDGIAIPVHGDGSQTRSFTYVDDHIEGLERCMLRKEAIGQVINLGSQQEISILNLAKMIWQMVRPKETPKIEMIPYETFGKYTDVMRRIPDITHCKKTLGYQAEWTLEKGLAKTIEWQKTRRQQLAQDTSKKAA